ncbi:antitermination protein Q [Serratia sp. Leaf50]|nr:antitermination protein Q [Serratia sp. Leaf50]
MRDIQLVLERWGGWAVDNTVIGWAPIAAGFKGLLPPTGKSRLSCCDNDGMIIDSAILRLKAVRQEEELNLIMLHYVYGLSKREIGRKLKLNEARIRQQMQVAEGFIDGCLAIVGAELEMDLYTQKLKVCSAA